MQNIVSGTKTNSHENQKSRIEEYEWYPVWHYSWEDVNKCLIGNCWQTAVQILPKSNLVNQSALLESFRGIWVKSYMYKQKWLKDRCLNKNSSQMSEVHQSWSLAAHCSLQQLNMVQGVLSRRFIVLSFLQAVQQVWESLSRPDFLCLWGGRGLMNWVSFKNFWSCWVAYFLSLVNFPEGQNVYPPFSPSCCFNSCKKNPVLKYSVVSPFLQYSVS